ncbi:uncharacterized protein [Henckelia pumila]|uniref:uncharacterized protein n=1 Tax=Henckelia pumila TaxID=405737 RepID=UPI003C6E9CD0
MASLPRNDRVNWSTNQDPTDDYHKDFETTNMYEAAYENYTENPEELVKFLEDAEKPLYNGCKRYTKLSALVKLYNTKARHGTSDALFSDLLIDFGDMLPDNHNLPSSTCPKCGLSRWKLTKKNIEKKGVPAKVMWYFPPIPRFKRMYKSLETSKNLTWHKETTRVAGQLRHPSDSPSWRLVDHMWLDFESEPRNLRLALAADGINPHSNLSSRYSCWPVMLATYNLPPNMCIKRKFIMLTMLISGPKQPVCGENTYAKHLENGRKISFFGHRRFLPRFHPYRRQTKEFNGVEEHGETPTPLSRVTLYDKLSNIKCEFGKKISVKGKKRKKEKENNVEGSIEEKDLGAIDFRKCWKKKSIFFNLPYWKHLHVRHCLDVMHIEKNVFESLINTLMNVKGKTKDNVAARLDMLQMGVRPELRPEFGEKKTYLPPSTCSFTKKEKLQVCQSLMDIKVPEGYSSNMTNLVFMSELKLFGLKSHDFHVLMQHFLPILIRDAAPKHVRYAIIRLCFFFKDICSKVIDVAKLDKLQSDLVVTLCLLEQYFPPSFFDVMVHLTVHLVREVRLCGPVCFRWMYPFERCMKVFKSYVGSRKHHEGFIVQRYSVEEAIAFCSEYINGVDPVGIPQ